MKNMNWAFPLLLLLFSASVTWAQTAKPATATRAVSQELNDWIASSEKDLVGIAEDMPEDKYNFAPTNGEFRGVRNFGKQVKHAAAAIQLVSAGILGDPTPADAADERGPDSAKTKAEIIKYLKDSYAYLRKGVATIDEKNAFEPLKNPFGPGLRSRISLVNAGLVHSANHYGQMVEYLRMNGIRPRGSN
ncbi:MAG: DinB family protein [Acidobacteriota bacterium]|nr:DinB family protein [Acidobacteriota bacterium]